MEAFDMKTAVHLGVEFVVIGGVCYWMHKRTSEQQVEINELKEENKELRERLEKLENVLIHHENFIRSITGGKPIPHPPRKEGGTSRKGGTGQSHVHPPPQNTTPISEIFGKVSCLKEAIFDFNTPVISSGFTLLTPVVPLQISLGLCRQ